jgi:hypothetical protein
LKILKVRKASFPSKEDKYLVKKTFEEFHNLTFPLCLNGKQNCPVCCLMAASDKSATEK